MIPQQLFKRRPQHNNTPATIMLIITNCMTISIGAALCINDHHLHWFFWVIMAFLAAYNVYSIRHNIEEYSKASFIAYAISLIAMIGLVILLEYA